MSESSQWQLPDLSEEQKNYVVDARASGMSFDEITQHFREVYPDYAPDIPEDVFVKSFGYRIKQMLNNSRSAAKAYLEAKQDGEIPINVEAVPLVQTHVRLLCYQRLWDETPPQMLQRVIETPDGNVERIYKSNARERLAILAEFRKELQLLELLPTHHGTGTPGRHTGESSEPELVGDENPWDKSNADTEQTE